MIIILSFLLNQKNINREERVILDNFKYNTRKIYKLFFFRKTDIRLYIRNIYFLNKFGEKISYTVLNSVLT